MEFLNKLKKHYRNGTVLEVFSIKKREILINIKMKIAKFFHRRLFLISKSSLPYEPLEFSGKIFESWRTWEDRWSVIKNELLHYETTSIIDIGCAEGWFVRLAAEELGCFSIGIERYDVSMYSGELARLYDKVPNCAIIKSDLNTKNIPKLPEVDVILCLSVLHHIVYKEGINYARDFIRALGGKAKKAIIFEMGTVEEAKAKWSKDMPLMPEGQRLFITEFLKSAGFTNIKTIGSSSSIYKDAERLLFVAETKNYKF